MRVPYIVGRWVRGQDHYGRHRLLNYLLRVSDSATWVVSTRRMGKTSLLRELELRTAAPDSGLTPLFLDLQGCESFDDLSYELFQAVEDVANRFSDLGLDLDALADKDAIAILRTLCRALNEQNRQLFLLIDEAEALVNVGQNDPKWLARLRKTLQSGQLRTVVASTKLLTQINNLGTGWNTSPFLFGFNLANLWSLDPNAARSLVVQEQQDHVVQASEEIIESILAHTNRHPYLTQFLCHRLFEADDNGQGHLRPVLEEDLLPDHLLAGFFQVDFQLLTTVERRILLAVAQLTVAKEDDILTHLHEESPARIRAFLYGLGKLGYVRQIYGQWAVGNDFMRRWLHENLDQLSKQLDSSINDQIVENLLSFAQHNELQHLQREIAFLQEDRAALLQQRAHAQGNTARNLTYKIDEVGQKLANLQQELATLSIN